MVSPCSRQTVTWMAWCACAVVRPELRPTHTLPPGHMQTRPTPATLTAGIAFKSALHTSGARGATRQCIQSNHPDGANDDPGPHEPLQLYELPRRELQMRQPSREFGQHCGFTAGVLREQ